MSEAKPFFRDELPTDSYSVEEIFAQEDKEKAQQGATTEGQLKNTRRYSASTWTLLAVSVLVGIVAFGASLAVAGAGFIVWAREPAAMTWITPLISVMLLVLSIGFVTFTVMGFRLQDIVYQAWGVVIAVALWPMTFLGAILLSAFVASA